MSQCFESFLAPEIKPLALSPTPLHTKLVGDVKEPTSLVEKSRDVDPDVVVWPVSLVFIGWAVG